MTTAQQLDTFKALANLDAETLLAWNEWTLSDWAKNIALEITSGDYDKHLSEIDRAVKTRMGNLAGIGNNAPPVRPSPQGADQILNYYGVKLSDAVAGAHFTLWRKTAKRAGKWEGTVVRLNSDFYSKNMSVRCTVVKPSYRWKGNGGIGSTVAIPFDMLQRPYPLSNGEGEEISAAQKQAQEVAARRRIQDAEENERRRVEAQKAHDRELLVARKKAEEDALARKLKQEEEAALVAKATATVTPRKRRVQKRGMN